MPSILGFNRYLLESYWGEICHKLAVGKEKAFWPSHFSNTFLCLVKKSHIADGKQEQTSCWGVRIQTLKQGSWEQTGQSNGAEDESDAPKAQRGNERVNRKAGKNIDSPNEEEEASKKWEQVTDTEMRSGEIKAASCVCQRLSAAGAAVCVWWRENGWQATSTEVTKGQRGGVTVRCWHDKHRWRKGVEVSTRCPSLHLWAHLFLWRNLFEPGSDHPVLTMTLQWSPAHKMSDLT